MGFFRRKVKVTPDELGKVLTVFTHSCSDLERCEEMARKVSGIPTDMNARSTARFLANIKKELFAMNMFAIVSACAKAIPEDKLGPVMDTYVDHILSRFSHNGWDSREIDGFRAFLDDRLEEYQEIMKITAPPNPIHHLAKCITYYMFGEEYSEDSFTVMQVAMSFTGVVKATKEMIQKSYKLV